MPQLNLFLLIGVAVIAIAALLYFWRKPGNRHPMETPRGKAIDAEHRREALDARTKQSR